MTTIQRGVPRTQARTTPARDLESQILLWLLHYPLQRAGDLASGLGVTEVTVGRLMRKLMEQKLVEQVTPALSMQQKHAWFYLTNSCVYSAATYEGAEPAKVARAWRADEPHLMGLLPRFPMLVTLQNLVRDLVYKAPTSLSYGGSKAEIRWRWVRDYEVTFRSNKRRIIRCEADAAVVFRRMAQDELRSRYPEEEFYTLLLYLDLGLTGFTERSTMYRKLRNLLMYRESHERQPYRGMFPLVVVVVESVRQKELWQQAVVEAARSLRIGSKLEGVIVNLASEERRTERRLTAMRKEHPGTTREDVSSSWAYHWRVLATNASCRLQECLVPMSYAAVPPGIFPDLVDVGPAEAQGKRRTLVRGHYHERFHALSFEPNKLAKEREIAALLGLEMSNRFRDLLLLLYANPLLSTQEVALFLELTEPTAARYLLQLQQWGCIRDVVREVQAPVSTNERSGKSAVADVEPRMRKGQEFRWLLSERGLRYLAASQNVLVSLILKPVKAKGEQKRRGKEQAEGKTFPESTSERPLPECCEVEAVTEEANLSPLPPGNWQPGVYMLHKYLRHTAGVYGLVSTFYAAARSEPTHQIRWFETGTRCVRRYSLSGVWHNFRPDAVLEYLVHKEDGTVTQRLMCWLEWDGGTMAASSLKEKMQSYAHYMRSREWRRSTSSGAVPFLIIVVPDRGQFDRMSRVAQEVLADTDLHVRIAMQPLLSEQGVHGEVWSEVVPLPLGRRTRLRCLLNMSDE